MLYLFVSGRLLRVHTTPLPSVCTQNSSWKDLFFFHFGDLPSWLNTSLIAKNLFPISPYALGDNSEIQLRNFKSVSIYTYRYTWEQNPSPSRRLENPVISHWNGDRFVVGGVHVSVERLTCVRVIFFFRFEIFDSGDKSEREKLAKKLSPKVYDD